MNKFIIAVYVDNKFGVLTRVTSMFTRRGFNIDTLTVGETESPEYSRITISMSGDGYAGMCWRIMRIEGDNSINRELALIKVKNTEKTRQDIMTCVDIFRAKIIDYSSSALCIEATGDTPKINAFIDILRPLGIIEMCRTGVVALERGDSSILNK